jgi:hypothetical protein
MLPKFFAPCRESIHSPADPLRRPGRTKTGSAIYKASAVPVSWQPSGKTKKLIKNREINTASRGFPKQGYVRSLSALWHNDYDRKA